MNSLFFQKSSEIVLFFLMFYVIFVLNISCGQKGEECISAKVTAQTIETEVEDNSTTMKFDHTTYDFDTIPEGRELKHTYFFTNTGEVPLIISTVKTSCGCLVPEWPKDAIMPNERGGVKLTFSTKGKSHRQIKTATVNANIKQNSILLRLQGYLTPKEEL